MKFNKNDILNINNDLKSMTCFDRVKWAYNLFKEDFCITSSFGIQAAVLIHIIQKVNSKIPILFIDTGYHFSETIAYKDYLNKIFNLNIITIKPELTRIEFESLNNYANENDIKLCCLHNKVLPLKKALNNYKCWAAGIRKMQTENRENADFFMVDSFEDDRYKLSPILDYSDENVELHYNIYELPEHPLVRKGYTSVGCDCCTNKQINGNKRSGRWNGAKTECGIHLMNGNGEGI